MPTTNHLLGRLYQLVRSLLTDPRYFYVLATLVVAGDAVLTQLIIRFVPYTEIDWETYIYQLELYLKGERDYSLISGPTGPIVYPAGHVHVHHFLYNITDSGNKLAIAQQAYAALYLVYLSLTCVTYGQAGGVPNWIMLLLPLSKRLHSIFVLRLFNDCWTVAAVHAAVLAYGRGLDIVGTLLFGFALSVKMSALLYLPGLLVVLFKRHGFLATIGHVLAIGATQVLIGLPFLLHHHKSYLKYSFEFSRAFLYKWTVNWRFVSEDTFLSPAWSRALLVGHVTTLLAFGLSKWCRSDGGIWRVLSKGLRRPLRAPLLAPVTADFVATVLFTSNLVGMLFARSLHYQFYSWYALQLPFLAWRTKYPLLVKLILLFSIEYAWNVFPSTTLSSGILCAANSLLVIGVWFGYPEGVSKRDVYKSE
ncbi:glycosyltransferase family 58 protein [Wolfiporia cocos MD-104 SS10]|uniref:Dol-P-Man:Man(5)GlcNAc(2)-PP-Dol alpha-1,3-mannosyltransferase n=1 Tax=Wolfiporia cocos (strain MD-104) TaxID=742152 RepID=A0A2H3JH69_WOLCO|nr:glycosyltransferase family 58 protein [Wolfiporia cocos MD-104 SS10]